MDDLRKGLASEAMTGKRTLLDLAVEHTEIRNVVFPEATICIDVHDVKKLLKYSLTEDTDAINAKLFFEKYLDELSERG